MSDVRPARSHVVARRGRARARRGPRPARRPHRRARPRATRAAVADVVARADGVLAGTACATEVFAQLDPAVQVDWLVDDGDARRPPAPSSARCRGPLRVGPHRRAHRAQLPVPPVGRRHRSPAGSCEAAGPTARIWDTRKTLPGLRALEKAAVRAGGGVNHRGSLSDFVLIKDNHLAGLGITDAVAPGARRCGPAARSRSSATTSSRCEEAIAAGRRPWCCSTT